MISVAVASGWFSDSDGVKVGHLPWGDLNRASAVQASPTLVIEVSASAASLFTITSSIVSIPSLRYVNFDKILQ